MELTPTRSPAFSDPTKVISSELLSGADLLSDRYSVAQPFPHVVLDGFFRPELAIALAREISALHDRDYRVSFRSLAQRKLQLGNIEGATPQLFPVYDSLMAPAFTRFVERVSGYPDLQADRQFTGAGLQRYRRGGFSEIHLDSNRHPFDVGLNHRVNLLIYLNRTWLPDWGGELVLWSSHNGRPDRPAALIGPKFNRAILFSVARASWHSVNRVRCPKEHTRNLIAIYYFNRVSCPDDERPRSVLWHSTHSRATQMVFEVTNRLITLAKPHARYLRWLRSNKFDGATRS